MENENEQPRKTLITKLAEINGELGQIKKQGRNSFHNYDYFTEGQLMAELRHRLSARGIFILPSVESIERTEITNQKGNTEQLVTVQTSYTICDGETGEHVKVLGAGMGADAADKGVYKALTGAMKYFLMKSFFISDAQDPEADAAGDRNREEQHSPYREPEASMKKATDVPASRADLATLITWMGENNIPAEFVMKLAHEGKLAPVEEILLQELKPATLARLLTLRPRIKARFDLSTKGVQGEPLNGDNGTPYSETGIGSDQHGLRQPVTFKGLTAAEFLEQEGVEAGDVVFHFGAKHKGKTLSTMAHEDVTWWAENWTPKLFRGKFSDKDMLLDSGLCVMQARILSDS